MTKENLLLFCGIVLCGLFCVFFGVEQSVERSAADRLVGEWLSRRSELWMEPEGSGDRAEYAECNCFMVMTLEKGGKGSFAEASQKSADSIAWRYDGKTNTLTCRYVGKTCGGEIPCTLTWVDDNVFILTDRHEKPYVFRSVFQRVNAPRRPVVRP